MKFVIALLVPFALLASVTAASADTPTSPTSQPSTMVGQG